MKLVLDANVLISAVIGTGPPARVLAQAVNDPAVDALICPGLLREVAWGINKPWFAQRLTEHERSQYLRFLGASLINVPDPAILHAYTRDPDDDYLVALAKDHDADLIVSGDKDLLEWEEQNPPVMTSVQAEMFLSETAG